MLFVLVLVPVSRIRSILVLYSAGVLVKYKSQKSNIKYHRVVVGVGTPLSRSVVCWWEDFEGYGDVIIESCIEGAHDAPVLELTNWQKDLRISS